MIKLKFTLYVLFLAIILIAASPAFADRDDDQDNMQNGLKHKVAALESLITDLQNQINNFPTGIPGQDGADGVGCTISSSIITCSNGMSDVRGLQGPAGPDGADGEPGEDGPLGGNIVYAGSVGSLGGEFSITNNWSATHVGDGSYRIWAEDPPDCSIVTESGGPGEIIYKFAPLGTIVVSINDAFNTVYAFDTEDRKSLIGIRKLETDPPPTCADAVGDHKGGWDVRITDPNSSVRENRRFSFIIIARDLPN